PRRLRASASSAVRSRCGSFSSACVCCFEMGQRRRTMVVVLVVLLASCPCASALNPDLDVSQYAHAAWKNRDGFLNGSITAVAQTPDGYLWIGTEFGLFRFDGVRTVPWQASARQPGRGVRHL